KVCRTSQQEGVCISSITISVVQHQFYSMTTYFFFTNSKFCAEAEAHVLARVMIWFLAFIDLSWRLLVSVIALLLMFAAWLDLE
ncbi:unnamed protein product, partial [Prunus brigantina]